HDRVAGLGEQRAERAAFAAGADCTELERRAPSLALRERSDGRGREREQRSGAAGEMQEVAAAKIGRTRRAHGRDLRAIAIPGLYTAGLPTLPITIAPPP